MTPKATKEMSLSSSADTHKTHTDAEENKGTRFTWQENKTVALSLIAGFFLFLFPSERQQEIKILHLVSIL